MSQLKKIDIIFALILMILCHNNIVESKCKNDCNLALASYYVSPGSTLTQISNLFNSNSTIFDDILSYNPEKIQNQDMLRANIRINVPFPCGCVNYHDHDHDHSFLGHVFSYSFQKGDTYKKVAKYNYTNLTTWNEIEEFNSYSRYNVPEGAIVSVPVRCSCGDGRVSKDYGLFITYPLQDGESLRSISEEFDLSESLLQGYNPAVDFSAGNGLVYIPGKDKNGTYPPFLSTSAGSGLSGGAIAGVCIAAAVLMIMFVSAGLYFLRRRRNKAMEEASILSEKTEYQLAHSSSIKLGGDTDTTTPVQGVSRIYMSNSVEFSYEELANATDNFNIVYKIGSGGFGDVYLAELRGEKAAIKKMDMKASREFLAELKVLTRVHHLHLVRLLGYCVEGSLCVVYEYIENGNLSQHLRSSDKDPLPWSIRVQIALDSAKGLEYIHEHTNPVYIHRDIKPANILITKNFQAKVADFGLTKLAEVSNSTLPTRLVGTFGYMPPEYAQFGEVTSKVDVYAFGVVLYELISAKAAVVRQGKPVTESMGLVALVIKTLAEVMTNPMVMQFEDVLENPDQNEICKLIDPRLGDDYPLDSVRQVALLAKACTHDSPLLRPSMRSIVVALMTLSSTTETWDADSFYRNNELLNRVSGR